jgi:uncharacterized protein (TIGR02996 family)
MMCGAARLAAAERNGMNEQTFHSALHEDPSDEVTWLALADWLDDNGQADRAELLRLTRRLRALPAREESPQRRAIESRLVRLLESGARPSAPEVVNSTGMRFALIPSGRFRMGSPEEEPGRHDDEEAREVEIDRPFYLGVFLVTQRQYAQVMGDNPSHFQRSNPAARVAGQDTSDFPVERTSWNDAVAFCQRLSETLGEIRAGRSYRLPTDAEWEYACRAGTTAAYFFGDTLSLVQANYEEDRSPESAPGPGGLAPLGRPSAVGSYPPNAWGLYDVHGNVYEWCSDRCDDSFDLGDADPQEPTAFDEHPLRGGSWYGQASYCRSAWRESNDADARLYFNGFRVAMERR